MFAPHDLLALAIEAGFKDVLHVSADALAERSFARRTDGLRTLMTLFNSPSMRWQALALMLLTVAACEGAQPDLASRRHREQGTPPVASESAYLALRDSLTRAIGARADAGDSAIVHADSVALLELERRLLPLIGPVSARGFRGRGRINLASLIKGDDDFGLADGVRYESGEGGAQLFVTTKSLFASWLRFRFGDDATVPREPAQALRQEKVYTPIFDDDAAVVRYAELPIAETGKTVIAAMLIDRQQDYCLTCRPGTLIVAASAGNRIFIVDAPARDTLDIPARCRDAAAGDARPDSDIAAYQRGGHKDQALFGEYERAESQRFADFLQCYDAAVRVDPRYVDVVAQARELIDALPDR